jgi:hypothetical protein
MEMASCVPGELIPCAFPVPSCGTIPELPHVEKVQPFYERATQERDVAAGALVVK